MAKTEHQGLQIALILFVMVAVVLAITTFVFYRQSDERAKLEAAAKKDKEDAATRANDSDSRLDYVMHILGATPLPEAQVQQLQQAFAADPKMKTVIDNYEQHMSTYGAGLTKEEMNYASILPKMLSTVRQMNQGNISQTADINKYKDERDNTQKVETARTNEALQAQSESDKKLEQELTKYGDDRKKLETQLEKTSEQFASKLKQSTDQIAMAKAAEDQNQKLMKGQLGVIESQKLAIIAMRDEPFEVADGQIMSVNQAANLAWINLGLADGLRRQTLFSVYDQADNGVKRTSRKASIEVTRVLDQHFSEARIVYDEPRNPILPRDQIFSPAWRPGKRVRFALAGQKFDIDGDNHSDRNLVRSLILASGGQIDAEMHEDGTIEGEITSSTRYLVLDDAPKVGERKDQQDPKVLAAWSKMDIDAKQYGVEIISIDKLLDWVGYRPEVRTVGLGKNADPAQFKTKSKGIPTGPTSEKFRERRPPEMKRSTFK